MIILDIETSGFSPIKNGIVSIGAICLNDLKKEFYEECSLDEEDEIIKEATIVNGFSEEEMRDQKKQTQKELLEHFFKWIEEQEIRILAGHNIGFFDLNFLKMKAEKYGINIKTRYRSLDLCSVAQTRYFQIYGKFLLDDYKENAMNLPSVLEFCGLTDERIQLKDGKVIQEGKPHNALEDTKLEAECFSRLIYGKSLFPKFKEFPIPKYLLK